MIESKPEEITAFFARDRRRIDGLLEAACPMPLAVSLLSSGRVEDEMKTTAKAWILGLLALQALSASAMSAKLGPGSVITLDGDSTLHRYTVESEAFQVDMKIEAPELNAAIQAQAPAEMTVTIPVASLKSEHSGLDKNLRVSLKADKNPDIVFKLKGYSVLTASQTAVVASGDLTVAGTTRSEKLNASLSWKDGRAVLDGRQPLRMSDFGVKPPTLMMGALKTDDGIVVKFHVVLEPAGDENKEHGNER